MKRLMQIMLTIFVFTSLFACKGKLKEIVEEKYPDGSPKKVAYYKATDDTLILKRTVIYYPNHFKREDGEYVEGKKHGKWSVWYDNGNLWSEGEFENGIRNGLAKTYYENGQLRYEGKYKDGIEVGEWKFWDEKGELVKTANFDKK